MRFSSEMLRAADDAGAGGAGAGAGGGGAPAAGAAGADGGTPAAGAAAGGGGADSGGLAAAAAAKAGEGGAAAAGDGKAPAAAVAYFPEGLDAKLKGATDKETLDNIAKHLGALPKPPEKPDGYTFKPSEQLAPYLKGTPEDNKVLGIFRDVAHKTGLSQAQFEGTIDAFYGEMISKGLLPAPVDVDAQFKTLGGAEGSASEQIAKGAQRVTALADTIKGFAGRGEISQIEASELISGLGNANAVLALEKIVAKIPGAKGPQNGGAAGADAGSDQDRSIRRMYPTMHN